MLLKRYCIVDESQTAVFVLFSAEDPQQKGLDLAGAGDVAKNNLIDPGAQPEEKGKTGREVLP